jgi:RHS repeat-associated protein
MQSTRLIQAATVAFFATLGGTALAQSRPVTTFTYDANGNLTSTSDALGRVTSQTYDTLNRLTKITQPKPLASQPNPVTQFGINGLDRLTSVTDARSLVTSYTMTGLGDLTQQVSPDTGTTINTFDAAGNLKTSKDARGKTTTYTYDGINRLTQAKYGDGTITYYYYDEGANSVGHLTRMVDPGPVTTTWTYTPQGRVATKSQALTAGGATRTHTLQYAYNPTTGQLTSITYPSGRVIGLQYGVASKEVETVTVDGQPVASSVTYHPFGGIKRMNLRNGLVWSSTLDQDGRITSYTLGGATYSIQWDSANRIVAITHPTDANWSRGYAYDGLDRIASFISQPRDQTFNYDATGNLLSKMDRVGTTDPFTYTYTIAPTSNRMTGISNLGIGYTIDAAGNRTADSTTTWVVNARGRVSQVRVISGATTTTYNYLINGQNLRVRKTGPSSVVPQGTQVFVYDEAGRLIGEYDNYGRARNEHVWLADRPVALIVYTYSGTSTTPLTTTYYSVEADHLGTPRLVTDSSQAQRWTWHSAPYGDTQPNEKPGTPAALVYNLRFPGQYFDKETNNFYNWHRDYESTTGRYIQSDPIGLAGGINTYAYSRGQPLLLKDPTGLCVGPLLPLCMFMIQYQLELSMAAVIVAEISSGVPNPVSTPAGVVARGASQVCTAADQAGLLGRYLSGNGGRWGSTSTRQLNHEIATFLEQQDIAVRWGAGRNKEFWWPGPGSAAKGGTYMDLTGEFGGARLHVQTVTLGADGLPIAREIDAINRGRANAPNDLFIMIPK